MNTIIDSLDEVDGLLTRCLGKIQPTSPADREAFRQLMLKEDQVVFIREQILRADLTASVAQAVVDRVSAETAKLRSLEQSVANLQKVVSITNNILGAASTVLGFAVAAV